MLRAGEAHAASRPGHQFALTVAGCYCANSCRRHHEPVLDIRDPILLSGAPAPIAPLAVVALAPAHADAGRARLAASLALAAFLHLGVLAGLALVMVTGAGNGGSIPDAIGVTIVDSRVLATRDEVSALQAEANAVASVDSVDGTMDPVRIETGTTTAVAAPAEPTVQPELLVAKANDDAVVPETSMAVAASETLDRSAPVALPVPDVAGVTSAQPSLSGATHALVTQPADVAPKAGSAAASPGAMSAYARALTSALARAPPPATRGLPGQLLIRLVVGEDGGVDAATVARSSGSARLDRLVVEAVERVRLPAPPSGMSEKQRTYEMPYTFR